MIKCMLTLHKLDMDVVEASASVTDDEMQTFNDFMDECKKRRLTSLCK